MDIVPLSTEEVRELFKTQHVLLIGDSIMRGLFMDLACVLSGNARLLYSNELTFNRHQKHKGIFGERIATLSTNRTNSTFNIEKRI